MCLQVVWLSGLFNPQSFLTAVMQTTARRNDWPLDKTVVLTEVTKKQPDQIDAPSREGAFIHGLTLEGCRWDDKGGALEDSKPKELFCPMPVILVRAVTQVGRGCDNRLIFVLGPKLRLGEACVWRA